MHLWYVTLIMYQKLCSRTLTIGSMRSNRTDAGRAARNCELEMGLLASGRHSKPAGVCFSTPISAELTGYCDKKNEMSKGVYKSNRNSR
jgi:hypothetical protein